MADPKHLATIPLPRGAMIGIIGGGQLGRMIAMAAARFGYRTTIVDPQADCPAAQLANVHIVAPYDDAEAAAALARTCDVVTYEFENVDVAAADRIADRIALHPPVRALAVSQDRATEKNFLNDHGLATAPWRQIDTAADLEAALVAFGGKGILKTRRLGYDGKGQIRFSGADTDPTPVQALAEIAHAPAILEGHVDFACEISIIAARSIGGDTKCYDAARNTHDKGILAVSAVPAGVAPEVEAEAKRLATVVLDALDYVGVMGIEFFVDGDDQLIANEFAPRVHNSGHWTEAACSVSQFEQHVRAITGHALGDIARHSDATMANLIGDAIDKIPTLAWQDHVLVHDYGKAEARPGRKMGHYTRILPRK